MKSLITCVLLTACVCGLARPASARIDKDKPNPPEAVAPGRVNVVLIFVDDMGYADVGCFGASDVRTPHIDRLATEGMKFTSYYAAPVCSMSRASLMTGCYNVRLSLPGVLAPWDKTGLHPDELTVAEVLKGRGYATACIGKWHLGRPELLLPTHQGFDLYFGLPYSNDMVPKPRYESVPPLPLIEGVKVIETSPDQSQLTRRYTERAVQFITEQKDGPFFLYLPHTMVHSPLAASGDFKGKSKRGTYGDAVEEIDWSVGQIMSTLNKLGLADNTLVMLTSDNGPDPRYGGIAKPLRGFKFSTYEGGVREPTVIRWPGHVPAGTTCDRIIGNIDVLPTFAAIANASLPADFMIDGRDFSPLLADPEADPVRDVHVYYSAWSKAEAIRIDEFKLRIEKGRGKKQPGKVELFNLDEDIGESKNLAATMPEKVKELRGILTQMDREIREQKRPVGKVDEQGRLIP